MQLDGTAAVVTGASSGVGRATALELARRGAAVLVNFQRSGADAEAVVAEIEAAGGQAFSFQADVADDEQCRKMIDEAARRFGRLDVLVNNAGTTRFVPHPAIDRVTSEDWDRIFSVNVKGVFQCARAARPHMLANGGGAIVNVASVAGITATGSSIPYAASKAAVINLTVSLARALAPQIRVNAVAPGFVAGRWLEQGLGAQYEPARKRMEERVPLGKVCEAEDVAAAILSLLAGSDMVTGQTLVVDGGMLITDVAAPSLGRKPPQA